MTSPTSSVPYGFCHCGCGQKTSIATRNRTGTDTRNGMVIGQPMKFAPGHRPKQKPPEFDAKPFKIDGVYCRLIPLTRGLHAIVDATDYEWLVRKCSWQATPAGRDDRRGFYAVNRDGDMMHRLILGLDGETDHRNRVGLDNRRANLRPCEHRANTKNASKRKDNSTGFRGVHLKHKKYAASLQADGKKMYFGSYDTPEEAARVYDAAARHFHGEFAHTNF